MKAKPSEAWVKEGQRKALRKKSKARKGKSPPKIRVKSPLQASSAITVKAAGRSRGPLPAV